MGKQEEIRDAWPRSIYRWAFSTPVELWGVWYNLDEMSGHWYRVDTPYITETMVLRELEKHKPAPAPEIVERGGKLWIFDLDRWVECWDDGRPRHDDRGFVINQDYCDHDWRMSKDGLSVTCNDCGFISLVSTRNKIPEDFSMSKEARAFDPTYDDE